MNLSSFFGFQSPNSTATVAPLPKQKSSSSFHSKKPPLKVHVPETLPKYQSKTYLPPTDNCASPLGAFGSSFLQRTSDLYNIVNIIDGDQENNEISTHHRNSTSRISSRRSRLVQQKNNFNEAFSPLSPLYLDVKARRNPDFDISGSPNRSPSSAFPNEEEIYIPKVSSPVERQDSFGFRRVDSSVESVRNSCDSGVDMSFDEKFGGNEVKSREINLDRSSNIYDPVPTSSIFSMKYMSSPHSSFSSLRSNSSLHKSSLYGPSGIPPFTSSLNDYIGNSVFSASENYDYLE